MTKIDKKNLIEILLEKRFGEKNPGEIPDLLEINTFTPAGEEEPPMGVGVQLIIKKTEADNTKEEYQVSKDGIVFSWGKTPVIDERSLKNKL